MAGCASIGGSSAEAGVAMAVAHCGDEDTGDGSSGEDSLVRALLEPAISSPSPGPTQQPVAPQRFRDSRSEVGPRNLNLEAHMIPMPVA